MPQSPNNFPSSRSSVRQASCCSSAGTPVSRQICCFRSNTEDVGHMGALITASPPRLTTRIEKDPEELSALDTADEGLLLKLVEVGVLGVASAPQSFLSDVLPDWARTSFPSRLALREASQGDPRSEFLVEVLARPELAVELERRRAGVSAATKWPEVE